MIDKTTFALSVQRPLPIVDGSSHSIRAKATIAIRPRCTPNITDLAFEPSWVGSPPVLSFANNLYHHNFNSDTLRAISALCQELATEMDELPQ
jgi:hypothetical protein